MAVMSKYCKAYPVRLFREYPQWSERTEHARPVEPPGQPASAAPPRQLTDTDFLYLHDNYTVTDGLFVDEHIVFQCDAPSWKAFCQERLGFEVPDDSAAGGKDSSETSP